MKQKKLAINGGVPVRTAHFPGWPQSGETEQAALRTAYESSENGKNELVSKFAAHFAGYCGSKYCIPAANGTVTLELILKGLGIGRGDEVILPSYTFIATLSAVIYSGATPVFADIGLGSYNISAESVKAKITPKTKAVIAVYIGGRPADLDALQKIADDNGIYLIGDAAQAVGSEWKGENIGKYGIAASFSCQNSKNLTCGEGGLITTNSDELYDRITTILNGGIKNGMYVNIGKDYNMTAYQAAILGAQMKPLDAQIDTRMENARYLDSRISEMPYVSALDHDNRITRNSCHLYLIRFDYEKLEEHGADRAKFLRALNAEGIGFTNGYMPLYTFPCTYSEYTKKIIGNPVDVSPLQQCEIASYREGAWLYQSGLLGNAADTKDIADAIEKICENIDELH